MGMDLNTFYSSTLSEIFFVCKGYQNKQKADYNIQFTAFLNAYGMFKGGKKFKPIDLFNEQPNKNQKGYQQVNKETRDSEVAFLKQLINQQGER